MPLKGSPGKRQKKKRVSKKVKKALVTFPTSHSEDESQSQSLLLTQPQGTLEDGCLAGGLSNDEEDGHGGEGEEASQARQQPAVQT